MKYKNKRREQNKEFTITVGVLLKQVLDKQKENIRKVSYDCVNPSDYEAGEIIAKKIIENKLV